MLGNVPRSSSSHNSLYAGQSCRHIAIDRARVTGIYFYVTRNEPAPAQQPAEEAAPGPIDSAA